MVSFTIAGGFDFARGRLCTCKRLPRFRVVIIVTNAIVWCGGVKAFVLVVVPDARVEIRGSCAISGMCLFRALTVLIAEN